MHTENYVQNPYRRNSSYVSNLVELCTFLFEANGRNVREVLDKKIGNVKYRKEGLIDRLELTETPRQ